MQTQFKTSLSEIRERMSKKNPGLNLETLISFASAVGTVGALALSRHLKGEAKSETKKKTSKRKPKK